MMLVAVFMHINVGDELIKSMPASVMLTSCLVIAYSSKNLLNDFIANARYNIFGQFNNFKKWKLKAFKNLI